MTKITWRHGLQGGRYRHRRDRPCRWTSRSRASPRKSCRSPWHRPREARLHILGKMVEAMGSANTEVSQFAPRLYTMKINPEKIRDVIGGVAPPSARADRRNRHHHRHRKTAPSPSPRPTPRRRSTPQRIAEITAEVEVGKIYEGLIVKILDFGALVNLLPGGTACCTSARSRTSVSRRSPTSCRKVKSSRSRC